MPDSGVFVGLILNDLIAHLKQMQRGPDAVVMLRWDASERRWSITEPVAEEGAHA